MQRIKVTEPDAYLFTTTIPIAITDLNYGGHLGNDRLMSLTHEARHRFYRWLGFSEMNLGEGIGTMMVDAAIQYKAEGFAGDLLEVKVGIASFSRVGFDIVYRFYNQTSNRLLALVKTGIICYDYDNRAVGAVSIPFKKAIEQAQKLT
ncbi:MAG: thioesterase family protein [Saprospiraceae bacterium]|nr:thioesterase family protein [Saprospiraceae bacterium]